MKKLILVLCVVLGTQVSFGQTESKTTPQPKDSKMTPKSKESKDIEQAKKEKLTIEQRAEKRTANLDAHVKLTPEQRSKIYAINLSAMQKNVEIRKNKSLTEEQLKEQIKASFKEGWKQIEPILTKEQKKILTDKKVNNKETPELDDK